MTQREKMPLRHQKSGGYSRGDETRQRIINAAIDVFSEAGFNAATTRQIAMRAEVNLPALQYYFGNKDGVYIACAASIADELIAVFDPIIRQIDQLMAESDPIEADRYIDIFCRFQDVFIDSLLSENNSKTRSLFQAQIQNNQGPEEAFNLVRDRLGIHINNAGKLLIARISQRDEKDMLTQVRFITLFGQSLIFNTARRSTLDRLGWTAIDPVKIDLLKKIIREQTRTLLESWKP